MNAALDPFIFVRGMDGAVRPEGIFNALRDAHAIAELADSSPLCVVSQLRPLLAAVARIHPLASDREWRDLWRQGKFPEKPLLKYFDEHQQDFALFGPRPFYQVASLTTDKASPLSKLAPEYASGNNATLFDHNDDHAEASYTPAQALRMLLVAQSFGLGGLLKAKGVVFERPFNQPNTTDAIIARGLTVWLTGDTLFETLMLNHFWGDSPSEYNVPSWESPCDAQYFARARTFGTMDRYTGLSRMVRFLTDIDPITGLTTIRRMYFTQGRSFDKAEMDPMQSYREIPKVGRKVLLLQENRATWRDLSALLQMDEARAIRAKAIAYVGMLWTNGFLGGQKEFGKTLRLQVAGLASDKAKVNLWRHDRVNLPPPFLANEDLVAELNACLGTAEEAAGHLWARIKAVCRLFLSPVKGMISADPNNVSALAEQIDTRRSFWARLEERLTPLLRDLPETDRAESAKESWYRAIDDAFVECMRSAKAQLGPSSRAYRTQVVGDHWRWTPEEADIDLEPNNIDQEGED